MANTERLTDEEVDQLSKHAAMLLNVGWQEADAVKRLAVEVQALRAFIKQSESRAMTLALAIRAAEWSGPADHCPFCDATSEVGHSVGCVVPTTPRTRTEARHG